MFCKLCENDTHNVDGCPTLARIEESERYAEELSLAQYEYEQSYLSGSGEHESISYLNYLNG